jgi:hypothetical protein
MTRKTYTESNKILASAEVIHSEIGRRLANAVGIERRCLGFEAPWPVPIDRRGDGVNWSVSGFPEMPPGCAPFMMKVLSEVMYAYDLREPADPAPDAQQAINATGGSA